MVARGCDSCAPCAAAASTLTATVAGEVAPVCGRGPYHEPGKAIRRLVTDRCSHHSTEETDAVVERCLAGLSEIVRPAGVSSETWLNVQSSPWKRDDAEWFKAHAQRAHRVRAQFPDEHFERRSSAPIDFVVVRQIRPGLRVRAPFTLVECGADSLAMMVALAKRTLNDNEGAAHAMFEMTQAGGRLIPTVELAELIARYATDSGMN
jgi:hypothetical protein